MILSIYFVVFYIIGIFAAFAVQLHHKNINTKEEWNKCYDIDKADIITGSIFWLGWVIGLLILIVVGSIIIGFYFIVKNVFDQIGNLYFYLNKKQDK